jgi:hypothetical protein
VYRRIAFWKRRFVDPDGRRKGHWLWHFPLEPLRMLYKGSVQNCLPFLDDLFSLSIVDILRGQESDSGMVMFSIVPEEEILTEEPGILDTAEPLRKLRPSQADCESAWCSLSIPHQI